MGALETHFGWSQIEIDGKQYVVTNKVKYQVHDIMSKTAQSGIDKAKEYVGEKGICFCNMRYDASFKHIYSVNNYKHSLSFARDIATLTGHTSLSKRIAVVKKHDFKCTSLESIISSRTTQEKEVNNGRDEVHIRMPDVMCAVNREMRIHVEMQQKNNGDIERRSKEYENLADRYFGIIPTVGLSVNSYVNPNWVGLDWVNLEYYRSELKRLRAKLGTLAVTRAIKASTFAPQLTKLVDDIRCLIELVDFEDDDTRYPQEVKELELGIRKFIDLLFVKNSMSNSQNGRVAKRDGSRNRNALYLSFKELEENLKTCYTIQKSSDLLKVNSVNLDGVEQLNVAIYLGNTGKIRFDIPREKNDFEARIQEIRSRWEAEIKRRKLGKRGKERTFIEEAGNRLCQRSIALQYLQCFSEEDFAKYITDETVKEECSYMSVKNLDDKNLVRSDVLEQLMSLYDFDEQIKSVKNESEISGKITEIIKLASSNQLFKTLTGLSDEYPQNREFITKSLQERSAKITDKRKQKAINSAINKIKADEEMEVLSSAAPSGCSSPEIKRNKSDKKSVTSKAKK